MRTRWLAVTTWASALLMACGAPPRSTAPLGPGPPDLVVLTSPAGLSVLDVRDGARRALGEGLPAIIEPGRVVTTTQIGGATLVEARDAATGQVVGAAKTPPGLVARVVAGDSQQVALMEPPPDGADVWLPQPRTTTTLVVADLGIPAAPARYRLPGNFEPEAFSADGRALFMLEYVPPADPAAYRVVQLDLDRGEVEPVPGKALVKGVAPPEEETMSGTRLSQTASADGSRLYTLYTTQPPEYAGGAHAAAEPVAFVHTLDLDDRWAHCIALPERFWGGDPAHQAMAASADGKVLYAVDVGRELITVINTNRLRAIRTEIADLGPPGPGQTRAVLAPDGEALFVATGNRLVRISTATLDPHRPWTLDAPLSGVAFSADGSRLYVTTRDAVIALDPSNGQPLERIPTGAPMDLVGTLEA